MYLIRYAAHIQNIARTKAFRYIESFFGRLCNKTFWCRYAILYGPLASSTKYDAGRLTEFNRFMDWYSCIERKRLCPAVTV